MHTLAEVFAAATLAVATAAMAQFGVKVRCHAPVRPAVQEVIRTPARAAHATPPPQARRYA